MQKIVLFSKGYIGRFIKFLCALVFIVLNTANALGAASVSSASAGNSGSKSNFTINPWGGYLYSRLETASTAGSGFSMLSKAGSVGGLKLGLPLFSKFEFTIGGIFENFNYIGPANKIFLEPSLSTVEIDAGFTFVTNDFSIYLLGNSSELVYLESVDATTYQFKKAPMTTLTFGSVLFGYSFSGYGVGLELAATMALAQPKTDTVTGSYQYRALARAFIGLGRRSFFRVFGGIQAQEYVLSSSYFSTRFFGGFDLAF